MLRVRDYGTSGPFVALIHGGPGAPGYMAPVARALADRFRVLEPFQRGSGGERCSVARHAADLHDALARCGNERPALVGHSWGAMLALAYAAKHPDAAAALVLIGCGCFDAASRARLTATLEARTDDALRLRLARLSEERVDPDARLAALGDLLLAPYSYDPVVTTLESAGCDARAFEESWQDMLRLQARGVYPAAFATIRVPVLMLHGGADPHPGALVRESLVPHLPQLEYIEWERCGHYPWLERAAREEFLAVLRRWLEQGFTKDPGAPGDAYDS